MVSSCFEGIAGSGFEKIPARFLVTCTGVIISPHGKPHQPATSDMTVSPTLLLMPHDLQEIWGLLLYEVMTRADQTL
jgi:hypothetical protein